MKFERNKKYFTIAVYAFLVILAAICALALTENLRGFGDFASRMWALMAPFTYGFVIAYILNPVMNRVEKQFLPWVSRNRLGPKPKRMLSILITFLLALLFVFAFFLFVTPQIVQSISGIVSKFPSYLVSAEAWMNQLYRQIQEWGINDTFIQDVFEKLIGNLDNILTTGYQLLEKSIPYLANATKQLADGILNIVLGVIISIYILVSKERFIAQIKKMLFALLPVRAVERSIYIAHKSHVIFGGFINGKLLDSLIIGILCFIGMTVFQMPNAVLISVIVGVTNVIPYFGPFIGAIPSALLILLTDPVKMIWFLIFILALQQFDGNILGPKILGQSIGLPAFWVIFSIIVFSGLLGVAGMFIGVPLFAVIYTLLGEFATSRLQKKGLPASTADYASDEHNIKF